MKSLLIKSYFVLLPLAVLILLVLQYFYRVSPVIISIPIALFLIQYSYQHFSPVYFFVNKIFNKILNPSTRWNFSVEHRINQNPKEAFKIVVETVLSFDDVSIWADKDDSKIFQLSSFLCEINIHQEVSAEEHVGEGFILNIGITKLEVPYRSAERILDHEVVPLLYKIQEALKPSKNKFVFNCEMQSINPYYGLLLKKVDVQNIERFTIEFTEKVKGSQKSHVQIRKSKITVVSDDLIAFQNLSRKYLILSPKI